MNSTNLTYLFALLSCGFFFMACGDDPEPIAGPCDGIEILQETITINGDSYRLSDPDYSEELSFIWQFSFDAINDDCSETYAFSFEFADNAPIYSGSYDTKLVDNFVFLKPDKREVLVLYTINRGKIFKLTSGGTATVNDNNDGTQTITLDGIDDNQNEMKVSVTYKFN